jgi:hypothetical protein
MWLTTRFNAALVRLVHVQGTHEAIAWSQDCCADLYSHKTTFKGANEKENRNHLSRTCGTYDPMLVTPVRSKDVKLLHPKNAKLG